MEPPPIQQNQSSTVPAVNQPADVQIQRDSLRDMFVSVFSITAFHWVVYLFFNNLILRVPHGAGMVSIFPDEENPYGFVVILIGNFFSITYVTLTREWIYSGRKVLANISLWGPFLLIFLIIAWFFIFFGILGCGGDLCGLGPGIFAMTSIALITAAYISLAIAAISIFLVRNKYVLTFIIILFTLLFLVPTIYTLWTAVWGHTDFIYLYLRQRGGWN